MQQFAGLDLSKDEIEICVVDKPGQVLARCACRNNEAVQASIEDVLEPGARIGMEAGSLAYPLYDHFARLRFDAAMGDAKWMKIIWECDQKFDKKDAFEIAELLQLDQFPRVYLPGSDALGARELVRARFEAVDEMNGCKTRVHVLFSRSGIRPPFTGKVLWEVEGRAQLKGMHFGDQREVSLEVRVDERRVAAQVSAVGSVSDPTRG